MNRRLIVPCSLIALTALAAVLYAATQPAPKPQSGVQVTLNYPTGVASPIPITVPKGTQFTVSLPSNATTGYTWQLGTLNQAIVKSSGSEYINPPTDSDTPPMAGRGGTMVWSFTAVGAGTQKIVLNYVRPWEKDQAPAKVQTFTVTVK